MTVTSTFSVPSSPPTCYGFIGLGSMGFGMASNLFRALPADVKLVAFDAFPSSLERFVNQFPDAGNRLIKASSAHEVAAQAAVVFTVLPGPKESRAVWNEVVTAVKAGTVLVECATVGPELVREMTLLVNEKGGAVVDAPISGGVAGANNGTLTFMVGPGDAQPDPSGSRSLDATTPLMEYIGTALKAMGKNIFLCGPPGTGQVAKLCNNLLSYEAMVGLSESLRIAEANGVSPKLATEIFGRSTGRSWVLEGYHPVPGIVPGLPASRNYEMPGFPVLGGIKDLQCAMALANSSGMRTRMGETALQTFEEMAKDEKYARKDFSSVWEWLGHSENNNAGSSSRE
ncbi:hypothetical protein M427DRAFT_66779 [Gonapodya prolifera JEL478]|uniref:3-hydroxyisobutyrate dehydrogenase n=1 Tax=Gonapodya prolifera (strain JEL478) TaxID=1344416 RepID=A0A139AUL1_GONPJ|nr:hypothetical protein M427DRAFT_66779 [Gonapodya prolifera JEL478]|eukprot:KXS20263.1 hypothetical protein M427DRAFT_66779 [Gonapodya prolifera JEL478]